MVRPGFWFFGGNLVTVGPGGIAGKLPELPAEMLHIQDWEGELKAYDFAPISMQVPTIIDVNNIYSREWSVDPDLPMDEDCLYLNVWTPAVCADEKLPVFVWYFGGGLQVGHTAEMEFDGERIARRGIVVVTVNYRLNAFGFLSHPEITAESPVAPANFGHLDQQSGTQWVKRNIAAFGGDPDQITIGGQSAGGGSVLSQLASPQNEGLFQRAVIMSGIFTPLYPNNPVPPIERTLSQAEEEGQPSLNLWECRLWKRPASWMPSMSVIKCWSTAASGERL
ncbi:carboxylesterase family protein [Paenibacillus sp. FSL L8-0436]|uniref:carboxylesterase family protein n=1 Tax=Paenibacillus sp. FSL L8-0436 TaxID=2954686 RepID=UPI00315882EC